MSSEISTYLTGRYVSIPIYTLSFKEYLSFKNDSRLSKNELFEEYVQLGGFPIIALYTYDKKSAYNIINGIYHTVVSCDIVRRHNIKRQDLFDRVVKYIIENIGKTFSANSISKFLKSENRVVSIESIYNYIKWLEQAFIIYPCRRYDLQGKSILKTQEKYYLSDISLKYSVYWGFVWDIVFWFELVYSVILLSINLFYLGICYCVILPLIVHFQNFRLFFATWFVEKYMDTIWIQLGYGLDTGWIQLEYSLDIAWIQLGYIKYP